MAKAGVSRKRKTKAETEEGKADSVPDSRLGQRRVPLTLDEEDEDVDVLLNEYFKNIFPLSGCKLHPFGCKSCFPLY